MDLTWGAQALQHFLIVDLTWHLDSCLGFGQTVWPRGSLDFWKSFFSDDLGLGLNCRYLIYSGSCSGRYSCCCYFLYLWRSDSAGWCLLGCDVGSGSFSGSNISGWNWCLCSGTQLSARYETLWSHCGSRNHSLWIFDWFPLRFAVGQVWNISILEFSSWAMGSLDDDWLLFAPFRDGKSRAPCPAWN